MMLPVMYEMGRNGDTAPIKLTAYLDPSEPIDALLLECGKNSLINDLPDSVMQEQLVGHRSGDTESTKAIVRANKWLIAALAYPYQGHKYAGDELLKMGADVLLETAYTFDTQLGSEYFRHHAAIAIEECLSQAVPEQPYGLITGAEYWPMYGVKEFADSLSNHNGSEPHFENMLSQVRARKRRQENTRSFKDLGHHEQEILPYLHLTQSNISELTGRTIYSIRCTAFRTRRKMGVRTNAELAKMAHDSGYEYPVQVPPSLDEFTLRQRQVATRLDKHDQEIAAELGLKDEKVHRDVQALLKKTGARTRIELALIAKIYNFEPSEEELVNPVPEALLEFTRKQLLVLELIHLPNQEIADYVGISSDAVTKTIEYSRNKTGIKNREAFAVELYDRGLNFDMREPAQPLEESFSSVEKLIASNVHKPYAEISQATGINIRRVRKVVARIRAQTGARSRTEAALIVRKYGQTELSSIADQI